MKGLLLTVGACHESEIFSIQQIEPNYVAFLCTNSEAADNAISIITQSTGLQSGSTNRFEFDDDPAALDKVVEQTHKAYLWLKSRVGSDGRVIANFTAGRKWMSAGLLLALSRLPVEVLYVDVEYENGRIVPDTERLVELGNAYAKNWMFEIERGVHLFNRFRFAAARDVFLETRRGVTSPSVQAFAKALVCITERIDKWDRFDHDKVDPERLENEGEALKSAAMELGLRQFCKFGREIQSLARDIVHERDDPETTWTLIDLFWNAKRRFETCNYEDAVARCYRLTEGLLDVYLKKHQIDANDVRGLKEKLDRLREVSREDACRFVKNPDDPDYSWKAPITDRNKSILAHGWQPVSRRVAEDYLKFLEPELRVFAPNIDQMFQLPKMPEVWS